MTPEQINKAIDATNVVIGDAGGGFCSGSFISKKARLVLTADHCVKLTGKVYKEKVEKVDPITGEVNEITVEKKYNLDVWQNIYQDYEIISSKHYTAKIVARDVDNDVAILQVIDKNYTPPGELKLAPDSHKIYRGQEVYAVGNPGIDLDNSLTKGIVSNVERKLDPNFSKAKYFQIDAAVIGGSSGGAIINMAGEIIGTLSAGRRDTTISFAVPVSFTKDLLKNTGFRDVVDPPKPKSLITPVNSGHMDDK